MPVVAVRHLVDVDNGDPPAGVHADGLRGGELATLYSLQGGVAAFDDAVRSLSVFVDLAITRVGASRCYAFVNCETTPPMWQLLETRRRMTAIPVSSVEYHRNGSISSPIVGPSAAIDAVPATVTVSVDRIGGTLAGPGTGETRLSPRQRDALEAALDRGRTPSDGRVHGTTVGLRRRVYDHFSPKLRT